jgi:hypothetical protein
LDGVGVLKWRQVVNDRTQVSFANLGHPASILSECRILSRDFQKAEHRDRRKFS